LTFLRYLAFRKRPIKVTITIGGFRRRLFQLLVSAFLCLLVLFALFPVLSKTLLFRMPSPSDTFDCDDGTLLMIDRFSSLGIKAIPIVGNLETIGEKYHEITHVWLLIEIGGINIAFDWGAPWLDKQHYEGYPITYDQLVQFVKQDASAIYVE
jgi:hypothetical protein